MGPYVPVDYTRVAPVLFSDIAPSNHVVGGIRVQLNIDAWEYELAFETDRYLHDYLCHGIRFGFDIIDKSYY